MLLTYDGNFDGCPFWIVTADTENGPLTYRWSWRYKTRKLALEAASAMIEAGVFSHASISEDHEYVRESRHVGQ